MSAIGALASAGPTRISRTALRWAGRRSTASAAAARARWRLRGQLDRLSSSKCRDVVASKRNLDEPAKREKRYGPPGDTDRIKAW